MADTRQQYSDITLRSLPTTNRRLQTLSTANHSIITDAAKEHGGTDSAADPIATLLASLLGCYNQQLRKLAAENDAQIDTAVFELGAKYDRRAVTWDEEIDCHFPEVNVVLRIDGFISSETLAYFKRRLRFRCAVSAVLIGSGTKLTEEWFVNGESV